MRLTREKLQEQLRGIDQPIVGGLRFRRSFCRFVANRLRADRYEGHEFADVLVHAIHVLVRGVELSGEALEDAPEELVRQQPLRYMMLVDDVPEILRQFNVLTHEGNFGREAMDRLGEINLAIVLGETQREEVALA